MRMLCKCGEIDCMLTKEEVMRRGAILEDSAYTIKRKANKEKKIPQLYGFNEDYLTTWLQSALFPDETDENPHAYIRYTIHIDEDGHEDWEWEESEVFNPLDYQTEEEFLKKLEAERNEKEDC